MGKTSAFFVEESVLTLVERNLCPRHLFVRLSLQTTMKQEIQQKLKASLQKLDSSKQSIETVSNWLKFYKHDFKA